MPFVIDASVTACWAFDDEDHPIAARALDRIVSDAARVPALWWFEVRNTLIINERRERIAEREVADFLRRLSVLDIRIDATPHETDVLALARRHRLTVYDSAYLELALREGIPLATLDGQLAGAARAEKVPLLSR
jgi:predicted nucleic acid-binding protein